MGKERKQSNGYGLFQKVPVQFAQILDSFEHSRTKVSSKDHR